MKTIGEILAQARAAKGQSLAQVEKLTKIRSNFIEAIEGNEWSRLPPFPTVLGFVKSLAGALGVEEKFAVAILKRDYAPQKIKIAPKQDLPARFFWSPKVTFTVAIAVLFAGLFGYLGFEYIRFVSPPKLIVESPKNDQMVNMGSVSVFGRTDSDAKVVINNQPVEILQDGKFSLNLEVTGETKEIVIQAISRSGKVTTVSRKIDVSY